MLAAVPGGQSLKYHSAPAETSLSVSSTLGRQQLINRPSFFSGAADPACFAWTRMEPPRNHLLRIRLPVPMPALATLVPATERPGNFTLRSGDEPVVLLSA